MTASLPRRVPQNAPGDFYVQAGLCTQCCLVHGEAPDLLNDPEQPFEECFFRRQPETPAEIEQAIRAICVSEMCALRYGGTDPTIIARLREKQSASQCDHTPEGRASMKNYVPGWPPQARSSTKDASTRQVILILWGVTAALVVLLLVTFFVDILMRLGVL